MIKLRFCCTLWGFLVKCFTFLCSRSSASWSPTAFISVFWSADVIYMCMSRNLSDPPCSACSISSWDNRFTNHSKLLWSRFIQKKSTWGPNQIWIMYSTYFLHMLCALVIVFCMFFIIFFFLSSFNVIFVYVHTFYIRSSHASFSFSRIYNGISTNPYSIIWYLPAVFCLPSPTKFWTH